MTQRIALGVMVAAIVSACAAPVATGPVAPAESPAGPAASPTVPSASPVAIATPSAPAPVPTVSSDLLLPCLTAPEPAALAVIIRGAVLDEAGALYTAQPVTIRITSLDASVPYTASTTTSAGTYVINNASPGSRLEVVATAPGLASQRRVLDENWWTRPVRAPYPDCRLMGIQTIVNFGGPTLLEDPTGGASANYLSPTRHGAFPDLNGEWTVEDPSRPGTPALTACGGATPRYTFADADAKVTVDRDDASGDCTYTPVARLSGGVEGERLVLKGTDVNGIASSLTLRYDATSGMLVGSHGGRPMSEGGRGDLPISLVPMKGTSPRLGPYDLAPGAVRAQLQPGSPCVASPVSLAVDGLPPGQPVEVWLSTPAAADERPVRHPAASGVRLGDGQSDANGHLAYAFALPDYHAFIFPGNPIDRYRASLEDRPSAYAVWLAYPRPGGGRVIAPGVARFQVGCR